MTIVTRQTAYGVAEVQWARTAADQLSDIALCGTVGEKKAKKLR
jgi:hypothetical protein